MKKMLVAVCSLSLLLAAGACKKKEEKPPLPQTGMPGQMQNLPPGHQPIMQKGETTIVVPDLVKGRWQSVIITVEDKTSKKKKEYAVNLNSELKLPDSGIKISVGDFLPDFKMEGLTITSVSNEPNNPAVRVKVFENDKEIFKGWLYSKFPTIHPFDHPKYSILLKNGVKKG
ncbi:MAG: DUF2155 domain-containing protein [Nitrospirota bacterium]